MKFKTTSIDRVIIKFLDDNNINEENVPIDKLLNWGAEALAKIGAYTQFISKVTGNDNIPVNEVEDYRILLPCDFHSLNQVFVSTKECSNFVIAMPMKNVKNPTHHNSNISCPAITTPKWDYTYTSNETGGSDLVITIPEGTAVNPAYLDYSKGPVINVNNEAISNPEYYLEGEWMKFNFRTGYAVIAYQAIPTDDKGFPLIPDNEAVLEAIYWYMSLKFFYPQWVGGQIRDAVYSEIKRSWERHRNNAYGNLMMPDLGELEALKRSWLRLKPDMNVFDNSFDDRNKHQRLK